MQVELVSVRGASGTVEYRTATVQDLSDLRQAAEALRSLTDWLQAILCSSQIPIVALNQEGIVLLWNRAAEQLFGWSSEAVMGLPLSAVSISTAPLHNRDGRVMGLVAAYLDLTEHRALRDAIRASEEQFRLAFDASPVGNMLLRVSDGRTVEASRAMVDLTGYAGEELIGRTSAELPGFVAPEVRNALWRRLEAEGSVTGFGFPVRGKDGTIRRALVSTTRVVLGGEECILGSFHDHTEQQKVEEALRGSEERLRLFIEHAPASLAMMDREMCSLAVSRRRCEDYDLDERALLGRCRYDVFPEIPERWRAIHRRALGGEVVRAERDRFERADGTEQWLRWEVRPWMLADGAVGGILIFTEEITASVQAEAAPRESETRFRQLAESIHEVFWLTDVATSQIIYISPGYEQI